MGYHRKLSFTGQWQFSGSPGPIGSCLKQRIIPLYGHTTYGHMSLTTVNDKSLWTKLKKVSLTMVNDKKIVIDHGQWQKKLSLTERYLYRDICDSVKVTGACHSLIEAKLPIIQHVLTAQTDRHSAQYHVFGFSCQRIEHWRLFLW